MSFASDLRGHMARLQLTVYDLAVMVDYSEGTVYKWLRHEGEPRPIIRHAIIYKLEHEKECRYNPKEIEAALKAYRKNEP